MNCTFYRPNTINIKEFRNIVDKLHSDLQLLETGKHDEQTVCAYVYSLVRHAEPLKRNPVMRFFGMASPESMPADARVEFFYRPTYIATAFMMKAVLLYPNLISKNAFSDDEQGITANEVKVTLSACMLACTGRGFDGSGAFRLEDCIKLFRDAGADEFLRKYPALCPEFTELYQERKAFVESGKIDPREAWYDHGHTTSSAPEYVWYACYGSNVNRDRFMNYINRCNDTTPPVEDRPYVFRHSIYFAKTSRKWNNGGKAFLDDTRPGSAYGRLYKITGAQFEDVKRQEGGDYTKMLHLGTVAGLPVYSFTDTRKNSPVRMPSKDYFSTILSGLKECYEGIVDDCELTKYLIHAIMPENVFAVVRAVKEAPHALSNAEISSRTGLALSDVTAASAWLVIHNVIRQDRRSVRAGHRANDPEAFFFTEEGPCTRDLVAALIEAAG